MKKIVIFSNALLICICLLLGFLLLNANDQLRQAQAQNVNIPISNAPTSVPYAELAPTPEITNDSEVYFSDYITPFGSIPTPFASTFCDRSLSFVGPIPDLEENNPIDDFFETYWPLIFSTMEENEMSGNYRDCWREEMLHAYKLVAQYANPKAEYLFEELEAVKEAMLDFTKKDGDLFAMLFYSEGYDVMSHFDENVMLGSGWPGASLMAQAAHYRGYTIYLYRVLHYLDNVEPDFIFDPEPLKESWDYLTE